MMHMRHHSSILIHFWTFVRVTLCSKFYVSIFFFFVFYLTFFIVFLCVIFYMHSWVLQ